MKRLALLAMTLLLAVPTLYATEQTPQRRQQFEKARMDGIFRLATFTQEEQEFVSAALTKYDNERFAAWEESWKIRNELSNGENITSDKYRSSLQRLLQLDDQRHNAKTKLFDELQQRLTPEQAYSVYIGMRGNNARTGQQLRDGTGGRQGRRPGGRPGARR